MSPWGMGFGWACDWRSHQLLPVSFKALGFLRLSLRAMVSCCQNYSYNWERHSLNTEVWGRWEFVSSLASLGSFPILQCRAKAQKKTEFYYLGDIKPRLYMGLIENVLNTLAALCCLCSSRWPQCLHSFWSPSLYVPYFVTENYSRVTSSHYYY